MSFPIFDWYEGHTDFEDHSMGIKFGMDQRSFEHGNFGYGYGEKPTAFLGFGPVLEMQI